MTDDTQPEAREFTMSQYASKDDMIGAMRKRIAELESELEAVDADRAMRAQAAPAAVAGQIEYHCLGPIKRFNLDCNIDGMDQFCEFVLAADHDSLVHDLETRCDPAGLVRENGLLRDQTRQLDAMIGRLKRELAAAPQPPVAWRSAVLDLIDECPGLTMDQDHWLSRRVKELDFPSAPQPTPVAQGDALSYEQSYDIRQGHEIASSDAYFKARPQIDGLDRRNVFRAGFERGWDAARAQAKEGTSHG